MRGIDHRAVLQSMPRLLGRTREAPYRAKAYVGARRLGAAVAMCYASTAVCLD